ncbi:hypothetical protein NDU88_005958 [Pleurodeles waltl]|uniref:Uncharacterized protein n=1 Tax=Pleurodeles waltl TaxID=8319 RepID=A0AAV7TWW1_PLEWA|nr:hypothetical protein NDU88_005958 [Pleurodeles waltl]
MRSSLLPGTEEGIPTDYAGTVLYLELSSLRPAFSPGQVNSAGEEGKLRGVTPCAGYRRLILGLCGATNSGSSPRRSRVPPGPRGTSCTRGPVPFTPGHQRLSGRATFIPARTLVSVLGLVSAHCLCCRFQHSQGSRRSPLSPFGPRPAPDPAARAARLFTLPFPPPSEAGVPFACVWCRVCFRCCGLRPGLGVPGCPPRGRPSLQRAAYSTHHLGLWGRRRALSPLQGGASLRCSQCHRLSRYRSPQFFTAGTSGGSVAALQLGRRSTSVDSPTPLKRPRLECGPISLSVLPWAPDQRGRVWGPGLSLAEAARTWSPFCFR